VNLHGNGELFLTGIHALTRLDPDLTAVLGRFLHEAIALRAGEREAEQRLVRTDCLNLMTKWAVVVGVDMMALTLLTPEARATRAADVDLARLRVLDL
jgi:hypothetical protein